VRPHSGLPGGGDGGLGFKGVGLPEGVRGGGGGGGVGDKDGDGGGIGIGADGRE